MCRRLEQPVALTQHDRLDRHRDASLQTHAEAPEGPRSRTDQGAPAASASGVAGGSEGAEFCLRPRISFWNASSNFLVFQPEKSRISFVVSVRHNARLGSPG